MIILRLLLIVGLLLALWDDVLRLVAFISTNWRTLPLVLVKSVRARFTKCKALKAKIEALGKEKKENFILESYNTMSRILAVTGEKSKEQRMRTIALICAGFGAVMALYLRSYMLVPILTIGCGLIPLWLIRFKLFRYNMRMQNELSVVLSMVTNSFIRCENIVASVKENIGYMNEPLKSIFRAFIYTCESVSPDIAKNLKELQRKVDNKAFSLWCDTVIDCQRDINSKANLNAVIEQFAIDKELYNMLSAEISKPMQYYLMLAAASATAFPLVMMMSRQFQIEGMALLFGTVLGQSIVAGYAVSLLYGFNVAIKLSTSME